MRSVRRFAVLAVALLAGGCSEPLRPTTTAPPMPTAGAMPASPEPSPTPEPTPGRFVSFRTPDGVRIAGRRFGDGPVGVVFAHQIDGDQRDWWDLAATLAEDGYATLTLNMRGYCPGDGAGCSQNGGTADAWRDLLAGARVLRGRGADRIVLVGASMGGTAAMLAVSRAASPVDGVITLSAPTDCCGMTVEPGDLRALQTRMLFIAGQDDGDAPAAARTFARWAGPKRTHVLILNSGEHGVDLLGGLATPGVARRTFALIRTFLEGVGSG